MAKRKSAGPRTQAGVSGFTGLAFVALSVAGVTIFQDSPGSSGSDDEVTSFYSSGRKSAFTLYGPHIVPFAEIAFL